MEYSSSVQAGKSDLEAETYQRLVLARNYIDECFELPMDLNQIASQAFFSPYHFLRLFRKAFNVTPHQYVIERRIDKAKALLAIGKMSVTEICFEVFKDNSGNWFSLTQH